MRKNSMLLVAGACLATPTLTMTSAVTDPSGPPPFRQLAGAGTTITQDVMNAFPNSVGVGDVRVIGSYDAIPWATMTTKDPAGPNPLPPAATYPGPQALRMCRDADKAWRPVFRRHKTLGDAIDAGDLVGWSG